MPAPIGSLQAFTPDGGVAAAQAAAEFGTIPVDQHGDAALGGGHRSEPRHAEDIPALRARR